MFKNYFKITWRNLAKDRRFTLLNLLGLSTGLACTLLIYLWVTDELQMDKFHQHDQQALPGDGEQGTGPQYLDRPIRARTGGR